MTPIRFAIGQMNPVVGDFDGNTRKIVSWIRQAERKKAGLLIFPELALSGYPVWDLANKKYFVETGFRHLAKIVRATKNKKITVVLGFIDRLAEAKDPSELQSRNALAIIQDGKIRMTQYKRLLPTYDVFLEDIFFKPGKESRVFSWRNLKIGPTICEDIWDDRYSLKPLADLKRQKASLVINISASPYYRGVAEKRDALVKKHTKHYHFPLLYVNQVGGQDDLIFDGRSFFTDAEGRVLFRAPAFQEGLFFFDWNPDKIEPYEVPLAKTTNSPEEIYQALVLGIRDYCQKNRFSKIVIGLSGGIDSALVATLAVDAMGPKAVMGVTMPGTYSSKGSWEDAEELARRLGIQFCNYPIKKKYEFLIKAYAAQRKKRHTKGTINLAMENLQARLRGLEVMFISNDEGRLLLSTGNKSELAMGYCTLYGDMAGGLCVLGDVYKTDVYRLAWYRNSIREVIPKSTLMKPPSAELRPNQKDEDSLPPYDVLDEILNLYIEKNKSPEEIIKSLSSSREGRRPTKRSQNLRLPACPAGRLHHSGVHNDVLSIRKLVREVIRKVDHNEYKRRQTPPVLRVTEKAWFGRRMPITNRFQG